MKYILFKPKRTAAKFSDRTDHSPGWRPHLPIAPLSSRCPSAWPWGHRWDKHGMPGWSQDQGHGAPASWWAHCWWAVAPALTAVGQVHLKTDPHWQSSTAFQSRTQNHTESMKHSSSKQNPKSHWEHETIFFKVEPQITLRAWNNLLQSRTKITLRAWNNLLQNRTQNHTENMKQSSSKQNPESHSQHGTTFLTGIPWLNGNLSRACHSVKEATWFRNCPYI